MNALKWLWGYLKRYRFLIFLASLITIVYVICTFIHPIILGRFVDDVIKDGLYTLLIPYSMIIIAAIIIKESLNYVRQTIFEHISQNTVWSVKNTLFKKLQTLDCTFFDKTSTGDLMSRLTMDTDAIKMILSSTLPSLIIQICYIVFGFVTIFSINPILTVSLFSLMPFIGYYAVKLSKTLKQSYIEIREATSDLNSVVQENISGNRVVKAYAREEYEINKFEEKNKKFYNNHMNYVFQWMKFGPKLHFMTTLTNVIFIIVGGFLVIRKYITIGEFTTINGVLWCIISPMTALGSMLNTVQQFVASSLKIQKLEETPSQIANHYVMKRDITLNGKVEFKNVSFKYEADRVLKNVNFTAKPGQTVAIIGPTGSGKSTIANLISRFYDVTAGTLYIDDINIKNIDIETMRKSISYAMQDVFLFSDTIHNNIAYGIPNATTEDVIRVAKAADAHDFISKMPDGYNTIVGERGVGLSGGQRQRISLARALLKNPAILILDDTTSAVDMETELEIQESLKEHFSNKTIFIIAHRVSSVKNADLILVLNQGNVVEWGTHEDLIKQNGYYKGVFEDQLGDFNKSPKYHISIPGIADLTKFGGER